MVRLLPNLFKRRKEVNNMDNKSNGTIKGIDISNWQEKNDFAKVKAQGFEVVYMKATEGKSYVDVELEDNYTGAKASGLKVGFYHFFRGSSSPIEQAQHFYNTIKDKHFDCRLALDIETTDGLSAKEVTDNCITFITEIERLTKSQVVVYTYTSFAKENLQKSINYRPLWIAHYGVDTPSENGVWDNWIGFQFTDKAVVNGVGNEVDENVFKPEIYVGNTNHTEDKGVIKWLQVESAEVGQTVRVSGSTYATGEAIPDFVRNSIYTIQQVNGDKVLLKEIQSWVRVRDIVVKTYVNIIPDGVIDGIAEVNTEVLNVRSGRDVATAKLGTLPKGTKIYLWYVSNGWASFGFENKVGYIYTKYVNLV